MDKLVSLHDQIAARYRTAWRNLYHTDPPIVRPVGLRRVSIISEDGHGDPMPLKELVNRIADMETWAKQASA